MRKRLVLLLVMSSIVACAAARESVPPEAVARSVDPFQKCGMIGCWRYVDCRGHSGQKVPCGDCGMSFVCP